MANALIRYFCLVVPGDTVSLGYNYAKALDLTGLGVRMMPIGPAVPMGQWSNMMHLMTAPLEPQYVNIVCAPCRFPLGVRMTGKEMATPAAAPNVKAPRLTDQQAAEQEAATPEVVYEPQMALQGLYTVRVPNIAITSPVPQMPTPEEVKALQLYDYVFAPTEKDMRSLRSLGVTAIHVPADASQLSKLIAPLLSE